MGFTESRGLNPVGQPFQAVSSALFLVKIDRQECLSYTQ